MLFLAYHETMTHHEAQQAGRAKKNNIFLHPQKKTIKAGIIEVLWVTSLYSFLLPSGNLT